jgi:hypothetical protein
MTLALMREVGWLLTMAIFLACLAPADSDLPVYAANLQINRASPLSLSSTQGKTRGGEGEEGCGCEDDVPPGAGFAFRREGYAIINLKGGAVARQRKFFENVRITFKEILSSGDGKTFPKVTKALI